MGDWDVMAFGDLCADLILRGGDIEPQFGQREQIIESYSAVMGGSNSIFACQCAKLGLHTAVVGRLGTDAFGAIVCDELERSGVDTQFIRVDPAIVTGLSCILQKQGDRAILTVPGSIHSVLASDAPDELLQNVRHLHIGSYYLLKQLMPYYTDVVKQIKRKGGTVSLDTNWDPDGRWEGIREMAGLVDIFLPNGNELLAISGKKDIREGIAALCGYFPVIAVKLGQDGALAYAQGRYFSAEALSVPFVDAVGAGDSFDAGFICGWLNGMPVERCLRLGCFCGSHTVTKPGGTAGQPTREMITSYHGTLIDSVVGMLTSK